MARELHINITTDADLGALDRLIAGFEQLEKAVKGLGRKNSMESMSKNLSDAKSSVRELNNEVVKLNRNMSKMVDNLNKVGGSGNINSAMSKTLKAQAQAAAQAKRIRTKSNADALRAQRELDKKFDNLFMAQINADKKALAAQAAARKKINTQIDRDNKARARSTEKLAMSSARMQARTLDWSIRTREAAMSRLYRSTGGLVGGKARNAEGFMGTLFQGKASPFDKVDKSRDTIMRSQQEQMRRVGESQALLARSEANMRKFWNTVDAGAQTVTKRGFSRSISQLSGQLTKLGNIRLDWNDEIKSLRKFQAGLQATENELRSLYNFQNQQRRFARSSGDMATAGRREAEMRQTLDQIRTTRGARGEVNTRIGNVRGEMQNVENAIQQVTAAMQRGEQSQAQYQSRLQQLRAQMGMADANFRRMQMGITAMARSFSQATGAISQFAGALRSRLNSAFSAANAGIKTLSTNVGSRFASMRAQLDATGKTFLGFGRQAKTGFSQADVALNEFFSAGWSLLASGSIVKMFGSNILRNMFAGLSNYTGLEQQMVRLGVSGGVWQSPEEASSVGSMRGLEDLIFGIQSGRRRQVDAGGNITYGPSGRPVTQFNSQEIADALYFFSSAIGADLRTQGQATADALLPMLRTASFTQTSPETMIKGTLNTMMEFGYDPRAMLKAGDTAMFDQVAGMVAIASNVSSMEVSDVFEAFKMMGPALNKLTGATQGAGLEDAMAAIFMASEVGLKGGNVGRGLDRLVTQLLDPDGPMQQTIKKYFGEDANIREMFFNDEGYLEGGLKGVFDRLISDTSLNDAELASMMGELFTQNAARAGIGIMDPERLRAQPGDENYEGSWAWFEEMISADKIAQFTSMAAAAAENTVSASLTDVGNSWNMVTTQIVESVRGDLLNAFREVSTVLWDIGYAIRDNPAIGRFITMLGLLAGGVATAVGGMMVFGGTILLVARAFSMLGGMIAPVLQLLVMLPSILAGIAPLFLLIGAAAAVAFVAWNENLGNVQTRLRSFIDDLSWSGLLGVLSGAVEWVTRIGAAMGDLARGPILGISDDVNNLHALMVDLFGPALGTAAVDGMMRLGDAIRGVFADSNIATGSGALRQFRIAFEEIQFIASRAGDAIRGFGEVVVTGMMSRSGASAWQSILGTLGLGDEIDLTSLDAVFNAANRVRGIFESSLDVVKQIGSAWGDVAQNLLGGVFNVPQENPLKGLFGGGTEPDDYGISALFDTSLLITGAQGAFAFIEGMVAGFGTTMVRTANIVNAAISGIRDGFETIGDSLSDAEGRVQGFEVTFTGAMRAIGTVLGAYLGARLITAIMPGFTLLARMGTAIAQLGVMFVGFGAQVAVFAARMAVSLVTLGVQIAATTAGLIGQGVALAVSAAMALNKAAADGVAAGATGLFAAATMTLTVALLASVAAFGAILLVTGAFAIGIFAVVAATQGFGQAISSVVQFLQSFWAGLQIGVNALMAFINAVALVGGAFLDLVQATSGAENRIQALGIALGVLGSVAILVALASVGQLIARFVMLFVTLERGSLVINKTALRFGLIGAGILLLSGPFQNLLGWIDQALDKLGVLGDALELVGTGGLVAAAISPKTTKKGIGNLVKWGGAALSYVGKDALLPAAGAFGASAAWGPLAVAALPAAIGATMYSRQEAAPDIVQNQVYDNAMRTWLGQHDTATLSQYAMNQVQSSSGSQWNQWGGKEIDAYIDQIAYGLSEVAISTIAETGELMPGWMESYIEGSSTTGRGNMEQILNTYLDSIPEERGDLLRQRWGMEDAQLTSGDAFFKELVAGRVGGFMQPELEKAIKQYSDAQTASQAQQNTELQNLATNDTEETRAYWGQVEDVFNDIAGGLGISPEWREGLSDVLSSIGIDIENEDFVPDLEKMMDFMANPEFDDMESMFLPGLKKYTDAMNDYEEWVDLLDSTGGDFASAAQMWTTMNPGKAIPISRPDISTAFGTEEQQAAGQEAFSDKEAYDAYIADILTNFDVGMLLAESIGSGLSAVFGATSGAGALGNFAETIMGNVDEEVLKANPWFNQDELMANAAIYGGGAGRTETGGKNLQRILRPMLEETAAELGVSVDSLMEGLPQYYFDPALMATAQTNMFSALEGMDPQQGAILDALGMAPDAQSGRVLSEMGMDWAALTQYAISTAMDGQDWDLSHYLMDQFEMTHDQAMAYLEQNGIDAQAIGSKNFEAVEAAYLSSNGEVAAATTEFWDWMYEATEGGVDNMVDITREEFEKIPEAWRILASNQGLRFNIIDESDVEHQAEVVNAAIGRMKASIDSLRGASDPLKALFATPGVSNINQTQMGNLIGQSGQQYALGGGSLYDIRGTGEAETVLNFNRMLDYGMDNDAATQGLTETYNAADQTYTILNELNGMQITIPAPEYEAFKQGTEEIETTLREAYQSYKDATREGTANNPFADDPRGVGGSGGKPGEMVRSFEEWVGNGADGLLDEQGNWIGPKMSEEASMAMIFGANVDWDGVITMAHDKTLAAANEVQSTWSSSFASDTQIATSISNMLDTAFEGLDVSGRAGELGEEIRAAIAGAIGGAGTDPGETGTQAVKGQGIVNDATGEVTEGVSAAGPYDNMFRSYATSAATAFGTALQPAMATELGKINFIGGEGGPAAGGPFVSQFEGFAGPAATAFGTALQAAMPAAISGGLALSYIFSNAGAEWGAAAGAAFASAFSAASAGVSAGGGTGTGGGNIGADGGTVPYGPGGGQGIIDEGGGGGFQSQTVTISVDLDTSAYDTKLEGLSTSVESIKTQRAVIDVDMNYGPYDDKIPALNESLDTLQAARATIDVGIDASQYFNGATMVNTSLTLLGGKVATPTVNIIDNASGPLQTILDLINSIPASKTSTVTVNTTTTNTTINNTVNRQGPTAEAFASGGVVASDFQIVGDTWGPELVELPRGSRIHNAWETDKLLDQNMLAASPFTTASAQGRSAPTTNNNINVTINNPVVRSDQDIKDISRQVSRELGKQMEAATRGQHPRV